MSAIKIGIMLLNSGRGSGEVARQQARQLLSRGHEVVFMHPRIGGGVAGATNVDISLPGSTIPVHEYLPAAGSDQKPVSEMDRAEALAFVPHYERALEQHIEQLDFVIGHHGNLVALATSRVCSRTATPYCLLLHGTGIEPRHHGGYDDQIWSDIVGAVEGASGLIVTTEYVRDALALPLFEVDPERFLILPCGVDLQEFYPGRDGEVIDRFGLTEPYVICPGALTASKGPQNVVEASKAYAGLASTVLIGGGELQSQLVRDLGDRGKVLGFVSDSDKADLICNAALLTAAPEKKEHFGIIYAEALAAGTPCVAYEGGGVDSIVTADVGVLASRSPAALGEAISALLGDSERLTGMAAAARGRAQERYDAESLGSVLEEWLQALLEGDLERKRRRDL